ncbi:MAG: magnesium and cobalt transport protein CorA [Bacteroidales bacterium]|nr:magnesium and cobalt transport protein CorA [Bacteroidales bacterium]MCI5619483.1 magnesium and cobalt transport protein CorA [Rikenellaceae bacterium]
MIMIFYRIGDKVDYCQSETEFAKLKKEDVIWIDLLDPTGEEKRATERFLGTEIQSRAQAEEIESSSRFYETDVAIFANTNYLTPADDAYELAPVSFIIVDNTLATLRDVPLRSITSLQHKLYAKPSLFKSGWNIFVTMLDQRIDLDADMVEILSKDTARFSKRMNQDEDITEDFLLDINQLQENTMTVRENVVDKQRLISNIVKSDRYPVELEAKFTILLQDIASLINFTNFNFERLEYLQDTVLGLINLEQNRIMKIFTVVSVLLMPATLVASFYGMNVHLPFADWNLSWLFIVALMLLFAVVLYYLFKKKKML